MPQEKKKISENWVDSAQLGQAWAESSDRALIFGEVLLRSTGIKKTLIEISYRLVDTTIFNTFYY